MKTSCIKHPTKEAMVIIRKWQMEFCEGNACAAALLSFYNYWHDVKLEIAYKNKKTNDISESHGDLRTQDESLLQFHTLDDLVDGIIGLYGRTAVSKASRFLESRGIISLHDNPNPKYTFDKTRYIQFYPDVCNEWLDAVYLSRNITHHVENIPSKVKSERREVKSNLSKSKNNLREVKSNLSKSKNNLSWVKNTLPCVKSNLYIMKEITAETTTENKTAAAIEDKDIINQRNGQKENSNNFAAAEFLKSNDSKINSKLTERQRKIISDTILQDLKDQCPKDAHEVFCCAIETELLNPQSFTKAGSDFLKKLNTVKKAIRGGRWSIPSGAKQMIVETNPFFKRKKELEDKLRQLEQDSGSYEHSLTSYGHKDKIYSAFCYKEIDKNKRQMKELQEELIALKKTREAKQNHQGESHE